MSANIFRSPRTIVALALLTAAVILGVSGVIPSELVALLLVSIAGGYGLLSRQATDDDADRERDTR